MDPKWIVCKKCGTRVNVKELRKRDRITCFYCREPLKELLELNKCDWSTGDYFPAKEERG